MTTYIGMDAHSKTCVFVAVDRRGRPVLSERVATSEGNLRRLVKSIAGRKVLAVESCGMARWVHSVLSGEVDELVVCNAAEVRRKRGAKTDFSDAEALAHGLRTDDLLPVHLEESELADLRTVVSAYRDLVRDLVRAKNRYKAIFRGNALCTDGSTIYSDNKRLDELARPCDRFVASALLSQIEDLSEQQDRFLDHMGTAVKKHRVLRLLATIPGISTVRASVIGSVVCTPERFESKHRFWSYCMLVRHAQQSDGVTYGRKRVHARSDLKEVFMGAAESVLKGETGLRRYYDGLREKGLDHTKAKKALARKIAATALVLMRKETAYVDNFEEQARGKLSRNRII